MTVFQLNLADDSACAAWDAFCERQPGVTLCHGSRWARSLAASYGSRCRSIGWREGDEIVAVLPVLEVRTLAQRSALISTPYGSYGGILHAGGGNPLPREADLVAPEVAAHLPLRGRHLVVRQAAADPVSEEQLQPRNRVAMWLALPAAADTLWTGFPAKVRNQVRKAEKAGVTVRCGREGQDDFYQLYLRRMHELGTPAHGPGFFAGLCREFGERIEFLVAYHEARPVAALMDIEWGGWRVNLYGAADVRVRSLCANNLVYWKSLEQAIGNGCRHYDFGRSLFPSGQYDFKQQWGARPAPIREVVWTFPAAGGAAVEQERTPPTDPLAARVWQRLPFRVTRWLSPLLRRYVY